MSKSLGYTLATSTILSINYAVIKKSNVSKYLCLIEFAEKLFKW